MRSPSSSLSDVITIISTIVTTLSLVKDLRGGQQPGRPRRFKRIALASISVTGLTLIVRSSGFFQPLELMAYDRMMQLRPSEGQDSRITVVTISEEDIQRQDPEERSGSLSDRYLDALRAKLQQEEYEPTTIGLDLYREFPTSSEFPKLKDWLQSDRFFTLCKVRDRELEEPAIPVHPEISRGRESFVGFSDVIEDRDGVIRRHLLSMTPQDNICNAHNAFSLLIALHYLHSKKKNFEILSDTGELQIEETVLRKIPSHSGVYQLPDAQGYQMPLNYRSYPSPEEIVQQVSISEAIEYNNTSPNLFKDKIVLIGVTSSRIRNFWETPYSRGQPRNKRTITGVFLQAHMISQIISAVLDNRPLIRMATWWEDALLLLLASSCGILLGWYRDWKENVFLGPASLFVLGLLCYKLLGLGIWVAFLPSAFAVITSMTLLSLYKQVFER